MATSVNQTCNALANSGDGVELQKVLSSIQTDLANLRAAHVAMAAKLDADATVTDTNYGSLTNPAALNTTA